MDVYLLKITCLGSLFSWMELLAEYNVAFV